MLALAAAGGLLAACSTAVDATAPAEAGSTACEAAARAWPDSVAGQERRETTADTPAVAAWGDPAVIARCGLAPPGPTTQECLRVDDVDWVVGELSDGVQFTTFGREPAIEVLVPSDYAPEPLLLPAFGPAARQLPATGRECS